MAKAAAKHPIEVKIGVQYSPRELTVEVELTPEGHAIRKDVAGRRLKLIAHAMAGFEPAEREAFVGMLERYVGFVDRFVEEQAGA